MPPITRSKSIHKRKLLKDRLLLAKQFTFMSKHRKRFAYQIEKSEDKGRELIITHHGVQTKIVDPKYQEVR